MKSIKNFDNILRERERERGKEKYINGQFWKLKNKQFLFPKIKLQ